MENCQISIIVPHYNTPDSLLKLLHTIPDREEVEVIVADDNSSVPLEDLQQKLKQFSRVQFIVNDSGTKGAGASRNVALERAVGKWVLFADADDFFTEGFYEKIMPYLDSDYDLVYFPPTSMDVVTGQTSSRHVMYMELVEHYRNKPTVRNLTELKYGFCTPWSKLIKRKVFEENTIQFDEILVSNDIMCMTKCAFYSQEVTASDQTIYCVTRGGKTLTSVKDEKRFDTRVDVLVRRYTFLKENLPDKEFRYAHIDRLALSRLVDVFIEHWGMSKLFSILKLYHRNGIRYFDLGLLNPVTLFDKAKIQISWWMDIKKHR